MATEVTRGRISLTSFRARSITMEQIYQGTEAWPAERS